MSRVHSTAATSLAEMRRVESVELRRTLLQPLREIPGKYLYDERGTKLYEKLVKVPEFTHDRAERALLEEHAGRIAELCASRELVDLGCGSSNKVRVLVDAFARTGALELVVLVDFVPEVLEKAVRRLSNARPELSVRGIHGDFQSELSKLGLGGERTMLMLGGTIGSLPAATLGLFLKRASMNLAEGDHFVVGLDLARDAEALEATVHDGKGAAAAFHRNILAVVNSRFGGDFDVDAFEHRAAWDAERSCLEVRLVARRPMRVTVADLALEIRIKEGEEIRTDVATKFTRASFEAVVAGTGLAMQEWLADGDGVAALAILRRSDEAV